MLRSIPVRSVAPAIVGLVAGLGLWFALRPDPTTPETLLQAPVGNPGALSPTDLASPSPLPNLVGPPTSIGPALPSASALPPSRAAAVTPTAPVPGIERPGGGQYPAAADPASRAVVSAGSGVRMLSAAKRSFYVDCSGGSDGNDGRAPDSAWQSLARVNQSAFRPGDGIFLKRDCTWDGGVVLSSNGTSTAPILLSAYGSGPAPWVRNSSGGQYAVAVDLKGSFQIVDGVSAKDANFAGARTYEGTSHNVVRNMEVTAAGFGVIVNGDHQLITHNDVHDLHMIVDTPGGDDDYGAVGYPINGTDNEISYDRCTNCRAPSHDYGSDGGFVEVWNNGDRAYIHHNFAKNTNGFFELGAEDSSHHANEIRVAYNVIENTGIVINVNRANTYSIGVNDFRFENNTVVQTRPGLPQVIFQQASPSAFISRNNIFYLSGKGLFGWWGSGSFTHQNNLYYVSSGAVVGYRLDSGEKIANPRFVDLSGGDYHLASGSPALAAGAALGYTHDYAGAVLPDSSPAIGAFNS